MSPPRLPTVAASVDISTVLMDGCVRVVVGYVVGRATVGHVVLGHVGGHVGGRVVGHVGASVDGAVVLAVVAVVGRVGCVGETVSSGHSTFIILPAGLHMTRHL